MAVYKVIQDIEAEDKLLGPLTLKGFIYALIAGVCLFIEFRLLFIGTPLKFLFMFMFLIPAILFGTLASPLGREQPTEVWLLSRIRFMFKPRQRIWDQSGMQELVTITAPKKAERQLAKDLTPGEVDSRLKALAMTLDTRGWAVKNVNVNLNTETTTAPGPQEGSDRLIDTAGLPQGASISDVHAADDILDEMHNPTAQKFAAMMVKADTDRKEGILAKIKGIVANDETSFGDEPAELGMLSGMGQTAKAQREWRKAKEEEELKQKLAEARSKFTVGRKTPRHKVLTASGHAKKTPAAAAPPKPAPPPVTAARQADNMELAQSGNDLSVASLSQLANRPSMIQQTGPNEVTISLH